MSQSTITINGTVYDTHSGLPIGKSTSATTQVSPVKPARQTQSQPSHAVHRRTQKSVTLNRKIVSSQKPAIAKPAHTIQRSPAISRFASQPATSKPQAIRRMNDIAPAKTHPIAAKAFKNKVVPAPKPAQTQRQTQAPTLSQHMTTQAKTPVAATPKPSHVLKHEAVSKALENATAHKEKSPVKKASRAKARLFSLGLASASLVMLGGYFTYLNMPSLSVRVAAAQAGVNASYPEYRPDGYGLQGPVAYSNGQVNMKFASNSGPQSFTVKQAESAWDSSAVLDNYVKEKAGDNYITNTERGLTIYTFGSNAAWVNGGVLYTIEGDAPLSTDQILRIASSM